MSYNIKEPKFVQKEYKQYSSLEDVIKNLIEVKSETPNSSFANEEKNIVDILKKHRENFEENFEEEQICYK